MILQPTISHLLCTCDVDSFGNVRLTDIRRRLALVRNNKPEEVEQFHHMTAVLYQS